MEKNDSPNDTAALSAPPGSLAARLRRYFSWSNKGKIGLHGFAAIGVSATALGLAHLAGLDVQNIGAQVASTAHGDNTRKVAADAFDQLRCRQGVRSAFHAAAREVNLLDERGVYLAVNHGMDDDCKPFAIPFFEKWQSMLGRHETLMNNPEHTKAYTNFMRILETQIAREFDRDKFDSVDLNNPSTRFRMIKFVNSYIDERFTYRRDEITFFQDDYVASPAEILARGGNLSMAGDCDDYTAFKFVVLRDLGIPAAQMFATIVGPREGDKLDHMILMIENTAANTPEKSYMILDNATPGTVLQNHASPYRSYMAFSGDGAYVFPQTLRNGNQANLMSLLAPSPPPGTTIASAPTPGTDS